MSWLASLALALAVLLLAVVLVDGSRARPPAFGTAHAASPPAALKQSVARMCWYSITYRQNPRDPGNSPILPRQAFYALRDLVKRPAW